MSPPVPEEDALEVIYRRLVALGQVEHSAAELKSFVFSRSSVTSRGRKLAESIAGLANRGNEIAYLVGRGDSISCEPIIDPAQLDDLMAKFVHPRIVVSLERREFDGATVDFVVIPKSSLRPHIIRIDDGRYVVPMRGLANNATAARIELDEMYQEAMLSTLRRAFPGVTIGERDAPGSYLESIGYGLGPASEPQFAIAIVPSTFPNTIIDRERIVGDRAAIAVYRDIVVPTINERHDQREQWFPLYLVNLFREGEDYLEIRQTMNDGAYRATLRLNEAGTVTYARLLPTNTLDDGKRAFVPNWLRGYITATLAFAANAIKHFDLTAPRFSVRLILNRTQDIYVGRITDTLGTPQLFQSNAPDPTVVIPARAPLEVTRDQMLSNDEQITSELLRCLDAHYDDR